MNMKILKIVTAGTSHNSIFDEYVAENEDMRVKELRIKHTPKFCVLLLAKMLISMKCYDQVYYSNHKYAETYVKYFGKKALTKQVLGGGFDLVELTSGNEPKLMLKYDGERRFNKYYQHDRKK